MLIYTILLSFFFILTLLVISGLLRLNYNKKDKFESDKEDCFISVIIPAHNEEENISALLNDLVCQNYSAEFYEVIVVNDRSTDKTSGLVSEFVEKHNNFKQINVDTSSATLSGKQNGVDIGINTAKGKFIVQTDADCRLSKDFLKTYSNNFNKGNSFLFSRTDITPLSTFFDKFQAVDLLFLFTVAGGFAGLNKPLSCMGNNIGYLKESYLEIGGYKSLGFSNVEDFQLLSAFRKDSKNKIGFINCKSPVVFTKPVKTVGEFIRQRVRWASGGVSFNLSVNIVTTALLLLNTFTLFLFFNLLSFNEIILLPLTFKIVLDFMLFSFGLVFFGHKNKVKLFPIWEAYYLISPIIFSLVLFYRKIRGVREW